LGFISSPRFLLIKIQTIMGAITEDNHFSIKTGRAFPTPAIMFGYGLMFFSLLLMFASILVGIVVLAVASYLVFNVGGFEAMDGKYRSYFYFLIFRVGSWKKVDMPDITILKKNMVSKAYGRSTSGIESKHIVYEITLLSKCHREKVKLLRLTDIEEAKFIMTSMVDILNVTPVDYSPKVISRRRR